MTADCHFSGIEENQPAHGNIGGFSIARTVHADVVVTPIIGLSRQITTVSAAMDLPELFECPRRDGNLRLTEHACATSFKAHQSDSFHPCYRCEIGARHAGVKLKPATGTHCAWCGKGTSRLIFKVLCVSCFNRLRELVTGKFRRGKPPTLTEQLNAYYVEVRIDDQITDDSRAER